MILAAAQTKPTQGDIVENLNDHYRLIEIASEHDVDLILFPEMSLTGYEREYADKLSFTESDSRLNKLRQLAVDYQMIIVVGAPIRINSELYIGSFILSPDNSISIYTKQFLHSGEEMFFDSSFAYNPMIEIEDERISLAICADIENRLHAENAHEAKSTLYIPSIFYTLNGISGAHEKLSQYAKTYSMNVMMSNFCGKSYELDAGGKTAFWNKKGDLIESLDDSHSGLLIIEKHNDLWLGKTIKDELFKKLI